MSFHQTKLNGVVVWTPRRFSDHRGFFSEVWNCKALSRGGLEYEFVQENQAFSIEPGTVRGLHFQYPPFAQAKLVRCGRGSFFDVAVDIRIGSPTFGEWVGQILSSENGKQMLVPEGFLHGCMTLEPNTEILYKCSNYYSPEHDAAVRFDDPEIGIDWPDINVAETLSPKDDSAPFLSAIENPFQY